MSEEILPERQEYLIELAARRIVDLELEDLAEIILEGTKPFGPFIGEMGFLTAYPSLVAFFGQGGHEFATMMGFNYTENAERILKRVRELRKEREEARKRERKLESKPEGSWLSRLKALLG